jgi:CoA:oxalate CoA-transferase
MIIKVKGQGPREVRTAGNPIRMSGFAESDPNEAIAAPALNQHREVLLAEFMTTSGAYAAATSARSDPPVADSGALEQAQRLAA